jgi:hypothetical protein
LLQFVLWVVAPAIRPRGRRHDLYLRRGIPVLMFGLLGLFVITAMAIGYVQGSARTPLGVARQLSSGTWWRWIHACSRAVTISSSGHARERVTGLPARPDDRHDRLDTVREACIRLPDASIAGGRCRASSPSGLAGGRLGRCHQPAQPQQFHPAWVGHSGAGRAALFVTLHSAIRQRAGGSWHPDPIRRRPYPGLSGINDRSPVMPLMHAGVPGRIVQLRRRPRDVIH